MCNSPSCVSSYKLILQQETREKKEQDKQEQETRNNSIFKNLFFYYYYCPHLKHCSIKKRTKSHLLPTKMSLVIRYIRCLYKIYLKEHENKQTKKKKGTRPDIQMTGLEDMVCDFFFGYTLLTVLCFT